ncbi:cytochrome d oxidase [Thermoplasma volcanium GSS1]|uniref:Cytochrome d oxidase n=1 Tax=Thermoplasma volcanium (strain ATCC 51530 / DSM 4299 / JCM 9571 / NBRC 15438 / GSS1) TaxID=273116 RepID=Q97CL9_THEVO|nr:cytochrome ubiquinol oxidase subunit I [Thermoplasma volcanium]BAB59224.1 cytochrome d oxidase [Thermoplasma volcanium GSS1]
MAFITTFDRLLFAYSIGVHIILVTMSISTIVVLSVAEYLGIKYKDKYYDLLAKRLAKVFTIFFAIGTASGIVMAAELVILFPKFFSVVAAVAMVPFYLEIFAFMTETIFLIIYIYYWDFFKNRITHWILTFFIGAGTLGSAAFIVMVNAWMNTPNGFNIGVYEKTGAITDVNPWASLNSPSFMSEIAHVVPVTLLAGTMLIGGYFAYRYLKAREGEDRTFYKKGMKLTSALSMAYVILAGVSGSLAASDLIVNQPLKYSAIELNYLGGRAFEPEKLFGTIVNGHVVGAIKIPGLQSFLAGTGNPAYVIPKGLAYYPQSMWPPLIVHSLFDLMVGFGILIGLFLLAYLIMWILRSEPYSNRIMAGIYIILGFLAMFTMEDGWVVDEVGRQPWIIYNVMYVYQAINTSTSMIGPGIAMMAFYTLLIPVSFYFSARVFNRDSVSKEISASGSTTGVNF